MDFVPRRDFEIEGILYPKGIFYLEGILSKGILWRRDFVRRDFEIEFEIEPLHTHSSYLRVL